MTERRLRRLRINPHIRQMIQETRLSPSDFIQPLFVTEGSGVRREVSSMPGVFNFSMDQLPRELDEIRAAGVTAVLLFGIPEHKDERGSQAYAEDGIVQRAVRAIKQHSPELLVITDVCLCEFTSHGHCGVLDGDYLLNDDSVDLLVRTAVSHVKAGADMVSPSDMFDIRVREIRKWLDAAGFCETPIMSYSSKFASAFYGPFREAAQSTPAFGDRKTHQLNPANAREALMESATDIEEGADIIMVKPALPYLDIIAQLRQRHDCPIAAYQVSGEYAMIKAAAANGWIDEARAVWETLTSIKRAGANMIITYYAKDFLAGKLPYEF